MDIFSKIDKQPTETHSSQPEQGVDLGDIVEKDGRYGYSFVFDAEKHDAKYEFLRVEKPKQSDGFFVEKRTGKLYKLLFKPLKECKTEQQKQIQIQKRRKKLEKLLKKGVNFQKYFSLGMDRTVLEKLPAEDIKLLYQYGFDVAGTIAHIYDTRTVMGKEIYFGIKEIDSYVIRYTPTEMLEKIIHTRQDLKISQSLTDAVIEHYHYYWSEYAFTNIQLLIKTGQMHLTPKQIIGLCEDAEKQCCKLSPELIALRQVAQTKIEAEGKEDKKISSQKRIDAKKKVKKQPKKSKAQEVIDKLFEDAQNTID